MYILIPHLTNIYQAATVPVVQALGLFEQKEPRMHRELSPIEEVVIFMPADITMLREVHCVMGACIHGFNPLRDIREHLWGKKTP